MIRLYAIHDNFFVLEGFNNSFDEDSDDIQVVGTSLDVDDALRKIHPVDIDINVLDLYIG